MNDLPYTFIGLAGFALLAVPLCNVMPRILAVTLAAGLSLTLWGLYHAIGVERSIAEQIVTTAIAPSMDSLCATPIRDALRKDTNLEQLNTRLDWVGNECELRDRDWCQSAHVVTNYRVVDLDPKVVGDLTCDYDMRSKEAKITYSPDWQKPVPVLEGDQVR